MSMKLTTAAVLLIAAASAAYAASPTIPEQFRGDWCGGEESLTMHRCKTYSDTNFRITPHTYGPVKSNWTCTFTAIYFNRKQARRDKVEVDAVAADALCVRDTKMKERLIFQLSDGGTTLTFLSVDIWDNIGE